MNQKAWEKIVYLLIYPAVLGSMIYDLTDLVTFGQQSLLQKISLFLIVAIYLADFATNKGVISDEPEDINTPWGMFVDVLAAIGFRYAFSHIQIGDYQTALWILFVVTEIFYFFSIFKDREVEFTFQFVVITLILGGLIYYLGTTATANALLILVIAQVVMCIGYILYAQAQKKSAT